MEEKNGSVIRRMVGYDRYEGARAYIALGALYEKLRMYVNFFQPSMKLLSKERVGAKVKKKYDKAKTPYQRVLASASVDEESKDELRRQMMELNPILLFQQVERLQDIFWKHAWKRSSSLEQACEVTEGLIAITAAADAKAATENPLPTATQRKYRVSGKPRKTLAPRTWKTKKDVFESVASEIEDLLRKDPATAATSILKELKTSHPAQFNDKFLRTLQRRIAAWRKDFFAREQASLIELPLAVSAVGMKC